MKSQCSKQTATRVEALRARATLQKSTVQSDMTVSSSVEYHCPNLLRTAQAFLRLSWRGWSVICLRLRQDSPRGLGCATICPLFQAVAYNGAFNSQERDCRKFLVAVCSGVATSSGAGVRSRASRVFGYSMIGRYDQPVTSRLPPPPLPSSHSGSTSRESCGGYEPAILWHVLCSHSPRDFASRLECRECHSL